MIASISFFSENKWVCWVGTTNPSGKLEVNGDIVISGSLDSHLRIIDSQGNPDRVLLRQANTNDIYIGDVDNNDGKLFLRTAGTEKLVVTENGNVGIGTNRRVVGGFIEREIRLGNKEYATKYTSPCIC